MVRSSHTRFFFVSLTCLFLGSSLYAAGGFGLTSYRPTGYSDTEWQIFLNSSLRNSSTNTEEGDTARIYRKETTDLHERYRNLAISNQVKYGRQTTAEWLIVNAQFDLSYALNKRGRTDRDYYWANGEGDPATISTYWNSLSSPRRTAGLQISVLTARYVLRDLFFAYSGAARYTYEDQPQSIETSESRQERLIEPVYYSLRSSRTENAGANRSFQIALACKPGVGRVYAGSFAYTALMIIEAVDDAGQLIRHPSEEEMLDLTELIFRLRNTSVPDSRTQRIEDLQTIMGRLEEMGVTHDLGPRSFALIQDIWDYYPHSFGIVTLPLATSGGFTNAPTGSDQSYKRQFGWLSSAGIEFHYYRSHSDESYERISRRHDWSVDQFGEEHISDSKQTEFRQRKTRSDEFRTYLTGQVGFYRPLGTHWQLDMEVSGRWMITSMTGAKSSSDEWYYTRWILEDTDVSFARWRSYQASLVLTYLFDARTALSGEASYQGQLSESTSSGVRRNGHQYWSYNSSTIRSDLYLTLLTAQLAYRIQIPTTLNLSFSYRLGDSLDEQGGDYRSSKDGLFTFSASLRHYLF